MYLVTSAGVRLMPLFGLPTCRNRLAGSFELHCLIDWAVVHVVQLIGIWCGCFWPASRLIATFTAWAYAQIAVPTCTPFRPFEPYCFSWHAKPFSSVPETGTNALCAAT